MKVEQSLMTHPLQFRRDSIETGGVINVQKWKTGRVRGILLSMQYQIWALILHHHHKIIKGQE